MKHNKLCLLLTSVGRRVELVQAFRAAADRLGVKLTILGADISASAPALAYCDRTCIVPRISSPDYIPALLDICQAHCVDALIPTIDTDLLLLSKEKHRFAPLGTTVFISAPEKIALCRDKRLTSDYFNSLGLYAPEAVSDIAQYTGGFPAFIKPIDGSSSIGANRADTPEELAQYAAQLEDYVVQPFASGTEYTVDIFCGTDGEPIYITPRIRLAVRSGEVLKTRIDHVEGILSEMQTLIRDFKPCGPITVQLIRDEARGLNQYIEINPRFGGGAPLTMKAGADAAEAMLRILSGECLPYRPHAASQGAVYSRFDQCVCTDHGNSRISAVIFDLDDTLYSEKDYVKSGYRAVAKLLPEVDDAADQLWGAFTRSQPAIDTVLADTGLTERKAACLKAYREHTPDISLYPGLKELLEALRAKKIPIGILTDGRPEGQRAKLEALGLYALADEVIVTDELGGPLFRKPCDIGFRILQRKLGIPFGELLYVGDNPTKDFQAPKALGMQYLYFENSEGLYSIPSQTEKVTSVEEMIRKISVMTDGTKENTDSD